MDYNVTTPKYYNRIDTEEFKGLKKLIFKAGDILQNTEMNEVQDIVHNELTKLTKEYIGNGQVINDANVQLLYDTDAFTPYRDYEPVAVVFNPTWDIMYVLDGGSNKIKQYTLTSPGDISSAVFTQKSISITRDISEPIDMNISTDGKHLYLIGKKSANIYSYDFGTDWDISSVNMEASVSVSTVAIFVNIPSRITFKSDGLIAYIYESDTTAADYGFYKQYTLSTAWDITTLVYANTKQDFTRSEVDKDNNDATAGDYLPQKMVISSDGLNVLLVGGYRQVLMHYTLNNADDISSAVYDVTTVNIAPNGTNDYASFITGLYLCGTGSDVVFCGADSKFVNKLTFGTEWDMTSAVQGMKKYMIESTMNISVDCSAGNIYFDEFFNDVDAKVINAGDFSTAGSPSDYESYEDMLGIVLTYVELDTLTDPAVEYPNYGQSGAYGLILESEWTLESQLGTLNTDTQKFIPIFKILNGEVLAVVDPTPFEEKVVNVVAKYDRNAHGNYVVDGLGVTYTSSIEGNDSDTLSGPFNFNVGQGSVNIYGYNHEPYISKSVQLPQLGVLGIVGNDAVDPGIRKLTNEPITILSTGNEDSYYKLTHNPIYRITLISGEVYYKDLTVTALVNTSVFLGLGLNTILAVYEAGTSNVVDPTDNWVQNGDNIDFLGTYSGPASVDIEYLLTENTVPDNSEVEGVNGYVTPDRNFIYLEGYYAGTDLNVTYFVMFPRIDTVVIDHLGEVGIIKGIPDEYYPQVNTSIDDKRQLSLAEVHLRYGLTPHVVITGQRVFHFTDIQKILNTERRNQYNIAKLALTVDMMQNNPTGDLRNTFIDNFVDDSQRYHPGTADQGNAQSVTGNLILDIDWSVHDISTEEYTLEDSSTESDSEVLFIGLPHTKTEAYVLNQPWYTGTQKINEYMYKAPPAIKITVHPETYRWITKVTYRKFTNFVQNASIDNEQWGHTLPWDPAVGLDIWNAYLEQQTTWRTRWNWAGGAWLNGLDSTWGDYTSGVVDRTIREMLGSTSSTTSFITEYEEPVIIPQIDIIVRAISNSFLVNEEVTIEFDGEVVAGTYYANSDGGLEATVTIPDGHYSGLRAVTATGSSGNPGEATFEAQPLEKFVDNITNFRWRWRGIIFKDPIAQSFIVEESCSLDGIKIFFEERPSTPVTFVITETTVGFPDREKIFALKDMEPSELTLGDEGTYFQFDTKFVLQADREYAYVVMCDDTSGTVRVAEMGKAAKQTSDGEEMWLTSQAYDIGVLYSSSNNSAWTVHQMMDMKFEINKCTYSENRTLSLPKVTVTDACDVMLLANAELDIGTNVEYYMTIFKDNVGGTETTTRIFPYQQYSLEIPARYNGDIYITVELWSSDSARTPKLNPSVQLAIGTVEANDVELYGSVLSPTSFDITAGDQYLSTYVSKFFTWEPTNGVFQVYLDQFTEGGVTGVQVYYDDSDLLPTDEGYTTPTWVELTHITASDRDLGSSWKEVKYEGDFSARPNPAATRVMIVLGTNSILKRPVCGNIRASIQAI